MILRELQLISEAQEVTLIGKKIGDKIFTAKMSGKPWSGSFNCYNNNLTSLVGAPSSVGGYFSCSNNNLTSLEGAPSSIGGMFSCTANKLTSLHDVHKIIKKINGEFYANRNPITSCVLGILLIEGVMDFELDYNEEADIIINKYLPNTRGFSAVIECQSELLDASLDEYAKL